MGFEAELRRHLRREGIRGEEFPDGFIDKIIAKVRMQGDIESEFASYAAADETQSWLDTQLDAARIDYDVFPEARGGASEPRTESGQIAPSRNRRRKGNGTSADPPRRQAALGRYLARVAGEIPDIRRFRNQILGEKLLNAEEAKQFICSPLTAGRSYNFVREIDDLGSLLRPLDFQESEDEKGLYRSVVRQDKKPVHSKLRPLMLSRTHGLVFPGDVLGPQDIATRRSLFPPAASPGLILFPHPEQSDRYVAVKENSVLDELAGICEKRLRSYPIDPDKGSWFILTGEFIASDPAHISYAKHTHFDFTRSTITLEVESWTPPEEVADYYRHAQSQVVGKTPRSLESKSLGVFEFVNDNEGKTWDALLYEWNKARPTQRFGQRGGLWGAYQRALEKVTRGT